MTQKFIDRDGLKVLWNQVNLKDYPNNETLMAVIDAIDETKANKDELFSKSWNDLEDKPFGKEETVPLLETTTFEVTEETSEFSLEISEEVAQAIRDNDGADVIVTFDGVEYNGQINYLSVIWSYKIETEDVVLRLESGSTNLAIDASLDIGTHTIGISLGGGVKQIDREFVNLDGVVLYDEQELSEEQQMQARKNLGLYNSYEAGKILYEGYHGDDVQERTVGFNGNKTVIVRIYGEYNGNLIESHTCITTKSEILMAGIGVYVVGNHKMAHDYDAVASKVLGEEEGSELPFVVCYSYGVDDHTFALIDESKLSSTDRIGVYRIVVESTTDTETVYETIPEEYIPEAIVRKDDINNLELITIEDIDTICGVSIQKSDEVLF